MPGSKALVRGRRRDAEGLGTLVSRLPLLGWSSTWGVGVTLQSPGVELAKFLKPSISQGLRLHPSDFPAEVQAVCNCSHVPQESCALSRGNPA